MRVFCVMLTCGLMAGAVLAAPAASERHRIGGGVHYWRTVEELDAADFDVDEDGIAWLVSYQYLAGEYFKLELDVEFLPADFVGIQDDTLAPQAFALLGAGLYGGLGVGTFYTDSNFADDPFYVIRAGFDIEVLPAVRLDINANYHFADFDSISDVDDNVDTDTVTLGAMLRIAF